MLVSVGSSILTGVPATLGGMLTVREASEGQEKGMWELYFLPSFAVDLKLLWKSKAYLKGKSWS